MDFHAQDGVVGFGENSRKISTSIMLLDRSEWRRTPESLHLFKKVKSATRFVILMRNFLNIQLSNMQVSLRQSSP
jgi:hypothetical protein